MIRQNSGLPSLSFIQDCFLSRVIKIENLLWVSIRYCYMRKSQLAGTRSLSPPLLENCSNKALIVFNIMVQLWAELGTNHMLGPDHRREGANHQPQCKAVQSSAVEWEREGEQSCCCCWWSVVTLPATALNISQPIEGIFHPHWADCCH